MQKLRASLCDNLKDNTDNTDKIDGAQSMTLIDDTPLEVVVRRPVFVRFRFATSPLRHFDTLAKATQHKRERKKWPMRRYRLRRDR